MPKDGLPSFRKRFEGLRHGHRFEFLDRRIFIEGMSVQHCVVAGGLDT
jgi:hypothetical protein